MIRVNLRQIRHQPPQNEILRSSIQRRTHEDEHKLCNKNIDRLDIIDGDTSTHEPRDPDGRRPGEDCPEFLPVVFDERLVDLVDADDGEEDGEDDGGGFGGVVGVEGPVVASIGVVGHCQLLDLMLRVVVWSIRNVNLEQNNPAICQKG
jgi:hypothetical protein